MKAVRMTSSSAGSAAGDGTKAQTSEPAAALRAVTRLPSASSRSLPNAAEFSISSRETTSASSALIAATIFVSWRSRLSCVAAPRASQPLLTVSGVPERSV
jgi:hypothetical protein